MKKYGWWAKPIIVRRNGSKFDILDGQHRFTAAMQEGLEIQYIVQEAGGPDMIELNMKTPSWSPETYVNMYATRGNVHYKELQKLSKEHGLSTLTMAFLLWGSGSASSDVAARIRSGDFKVQYADHAKLVLEVVTNLATHVAWARSAHCVAALSRVLKVEGVDEELLVKKFKTNASRLKHQPTIETYYAMFHDVYNYHTPDSKKLEIFVNAKRIQEGKKQIS
jgi:hypothetical protein